MEKWEYKIFTDALSYTPDYEGTLIEHLETKKKLNKLGQEGWELVSTNIYDYPQKNAQTGLPYETEIYYFLKRKIS